MAWSGRNLFPEKYSVRHEMDGRNLFPELPKLRKGGGRLSGGAFCAHYSFPLDEAVVSLYLMIGHVLSRSEF